MTQPSLRPKLAQLAGRPLRIRAQSLAHGLLTGSHRATRKGSGIEFAEHRSYTPGDDLRHLDHHALLRHGRLLIRQFQADTERSLHIVCDVSASMAYRDADKESASKAQVAILMAAALAFATHSQGDAVGISLLSEKHSNTLPPRHSRQAWDQILDLLEKEETRLELLEQNNKPADPPSHVAPDAAAQNWKNLCSFLGGKLARGALIIFISDFLDLTPETGRQMLELSTRGRSVRAAQVLSSTEIDFPFDGPLRLFDPEHGLDISTDASSARARYQQALNELTADFQHRLTGEGGLFLRVSTKEELLPALVQLASGQLRSRSQ